MRLSELLIMMMVISLFSTGFVAFYGALMNANGLTAQNFSYTNNTSATVTTISNIYTNIEASQNQSSGLASGLVAFAPINLMFAAFNAVMTALQTPVFFYSLIVDMTSSITGFPVWVSRMLTTIVMIIVISAIIYMIIGRPF